MVIITDIFFIFKVGRVVPYLPLAVLLAATGRATLGSARHADVIKIWVLWLL